MIAELLVLDNSGVSSQMLVITASLLQLTTPVHRDEHNQTQCN